MVSSSCSEEHNQNTIRRSPSSFSDHVSNISSSSSSSLSHHHHHNHQQPPRTMEEDAWKGIISLSESPSLHQQQQQQLNPIKTTTLRPGCYHSTRSFQDFLGKRPTSHNGHQIPPQPRSHNNNNNGSSSSTSSPTMTTPNHNYPPTSLSLNTATEFRYIVDSPNHNPLFRPMIYLPSRTNPFEALSSSFGKTGFPSSKETHSSITTVTTTHTSPVDRKHKRLVKNRESAARSRARKEAYINELERSVEELREENRMLLKIVEDLHHARQDQLPKKRSFKRSSTAPL